ncbi:ABC transporter substrate-binding protein [Halarsenatibacter silvermanii]|uniref:ABC-type glycerol-3-phosphate transport system, substrate-binding protein n=1 Tax=Halarsenatibacter silvermanii TaxID=321763 RepID=A0A1G9LYK1_9FIRM|nr:extracellular solute-binding protein [Halarsenatibacter silvermanii]SDL67079.1 ABC-type glycerol-3-phosphate transport system, substrate-binding protein [Halarsenatibacter silvermanii]
MKKLFLISLLLIFVFTGFAMEAEAQETTIEVWFGREEFVPDDEFETFHEENPDIQVEFDVIPLEESHTDFMRNHAVGEDPDIVQIFHEFIATMVAEGTVMDISEYIEAWEEDDPEDFAEIYDIAWDLTTYNDGIYGVNIHSAPYYMGYRKDWLDEAGLDEPETWSELLDQLKVLQDEVLEEDADEYAYAQPGGAHHPPFWMMSTFMSMGGEFTESGLPIIDSEAGIELIEFYMALGEEGLQDPEADVWASGDMRGAFMGGRAGFFPEAINIFAYTQEELEYNEEWEVMVQPHREGAEEDFVVNTFGWPHMVSSNTEHPEEVMEVLKYLFDPEIVMDVAKRYQPANRADVLETEEYREAHPYFEILEDAHAEQEPYPTHVRSVQRDDILNEMKYEAQQAEVSAEELAEQYQEKLDELDQ